MEPLLLPDELHLRKFVSPEIVFGVGARWLLGRYVQNLGARRVLVVTDPGIVEAGWAKQALESLGEADVHYIVFDGVTPNPKTDEVMNGAEIYKREHCDVIAAVGGGSAIDCAKGIGIVGTNKEHISEFEGVDQVNTAIPPLVCIPTTAGSSADVSQFAIIMDRVRRVKMAIVSKAVVPDVALIDPVTLTTMSSYLTACTGLDALTHAIEAFVSNASSPITDLHALEAIKLIPEFLPASIENPDDIVIRGKMMLASMEAGLAFSNAILGAVHAMAHSLGGLLDLAHGECNAILLEPVIDFNYGAVPERYRLIAQAMGINTDKMKSEQIKTSLLAKIRDLRQAVGVVRGLKGIGVKPDDIPELTSRALEDACMFTNPVTPTADQVEAIYHAAL
ncbi:alcohol dehydrogenase-like regulatory protein ErcA [Syntrophomonas palmitatica]|uniref:alcohol dehydrogenase-like regulatory protein ErcA n=1 Tax=Syntrophomonas palmitatica TaxID=402877 RepID=UPI000ACE3DD1|nr:alcohol dehydrogenase-like regulatory protein ErcA [Syntrophomonas palmitatica]